MHNAGAIKVTNWRRFQQYRDRSPKWIKVHRDILRDHKFSILNDRDKAHLMLIWVLAAELDNEIPFDEQWIRRQIGAEKPIDLEKLISLGFLELYNSVQECTEVCAPPYDSVQNRTNLYLETETETETETEKDICLFPEKTFPEGSDEADKDPDNEPGELTVEELFEDARDQYPGEKRGFETEFKYFKKQHKDWRDVVANLALAIQLEMDHREADAKAKKFVPPWKHFKTWINNRCWEVPLERLRREENLP
jgi:hypothetical protein